MSRSRPDPDVSDLSTTATLVHVMRSSRWNRAQIHHAMMQPEALGGSYYRWRYEAEGETFTEFIWAHCTQLREVGVPLCTCSPFVQGPDLNCEMHWALAVE